MVLVLSWALTGMIKKFIVKNFVAMLVQQKNFNVKYFHKNSAVEKVQHDSVFLFELFSLDIHKVWSLAHPFIKCDRIW